MFDVYASYKEAKDIWDSLILKYITEDVVKQRFVIENYYHLEIIEGKDIKIQINEYHKLLEDIKAENIALLDEFVSELLIEKLPQSWTNYKQQRTYSPSLAHYTLGPRILHSGSLETVFVWILHSLYSRQLWFLSVSHLRIPLTSSVSLLHDLWKPSYKHSVSLLSRSMQGQSARLRPSKTPFISGGCATQTWSSVANGWNVGCGRLGLLHFPYINKGFLHPKSTSLTHLPSSSPS